MIFTIGSLWGGLLVVGNYLEIDVVALFSSLVLFTWTYANA